MKAYLYKDKIVIRPRPTQNGHTLHVNLVKSLDENCLPTVNTSIYAGQSTYVLPCERENIKSVYIV